MEERLLIHDHFDKKFKPLLTYLKGYNLEHVMQSIDLYNIIMSHYLYLTQFYPSKL